MGQRANYIIKDNNKLAIHYNHWRANQVASDLYLGEKRFLEFVNECQLNDEIINEPWIEGCVIIDKNKRELFFWSFEFSRDTSVVDYYMKQLLKKWEGWKLTILKNRMYDAEKLLGIDYISKQELSPIKRISEEDILADKVEEWIAALIIIKQDSSLFITKTGSLRAENIISYGQNIISLIKNKPQYNLPKEGEEGTGECVVIDEDERKVFVSESSIGLLESSKELWNDYELVIGDFGYLETLRLANVDTLELELPIEEIKKQFTEMIQTDDSFDPLEMAEKIKREHKDIQFNHDFFDNVKPKKSIVEKVRISIKKFLK